MTRNPWLLFCIASQAFLGAFSSQANDPFANAFDFLTHGHYGQPSLNDQIFENLWQVWDGEDQIKSSNATKQQRREIAFERYGLVKAPYENGNLPMGYTKDRSGTWFDNCLLCHGGTILGHPMVGVPNNRLDLATLNEDIFLLSMSMHGKTVERPIQLPFSMNQSRGVTNSVIFGKLFLERRDKDLDLLSFPLSLGPTIDHDLDAPAWWNVKRKDRLYYDGFAPKDARALMQFAMGHENSGDQIRGMLPNFEGLLAYLESIEPPKYPGTINSKVAGKGERLFQTHCATCHTTNRLVPIGVLKTDPDRLAGLTPEFREYYRSSWLGNYGKSEVRVKGEGYVAPPLNGIWASAPYLHNGSVPTLFHILNPEQRPKVWRVRDYNSYDNDKMGLVIDQLTHIPIGLTPSETRSFFDTSKPSKSNLGHYFPNALNEQEKIEVLEFLKTL